MLESDLSGSLRQMKPINNDELLQDRFDTIYRTNKVEPNEDVFDARRNKHKKEFKFHQPVGTTAKELAAENAKRKAKNDEDEAGLAGALASDVIII